MPGSGKTARRTLNQLSRLYLCRRFHNARIFCSIIGSSKLLTIARKARASGTGLYLSHCGSLSGFFSSSNVECQGANQ